MATYRIYFGNRTAAAGAVALNGAIDSNIEQSGNLNFVLALSGAIDGNLAQTGNLKSALVLSGAVDLISNRKVIF